MISPWIVGRSLAHGESESLLLPLQAEVQGDSRRACAGRRVEACKQFRTSSRAESERGRLTVSHEKGVSESRLVSVVCVDVISGRPHGCSARTCVRGNRDEKKQTTADSVSMRSSRRAARDLPFGDDCFV